MTSIEERKLWRNGEWNNEPDELSWITSSDLPAYIKRGSLGFLCGYVGVFKNSPLYDKNYASLNLDVHGGLTYSGFDIKIQIVKIYFI